VLQLRSDGMEFASEMIARASQARIPMAEVPTDLRRDGRDRLPHLRPWRDGVRHVRLLLGLRFGARDAAPSSPLWTSALFACLAINAAIHLVSLAGYGYHHDELLHIAAAGRPQLGYLGGPGLSHWLLAVEIWISGTSLWAVRIPCLLWGAGLIVVLHGITRELGGGTTARFLAGLLPSTAPFWLGLHSYYNEHMLDLFFWALAQWGAVRVLRSEGAAGWFLLAGGLSLGLLNRLTIGALSLALLAGLLCSGAARRSPLRQALVRRVPLVAAACLLALSPYLVWQAINVRVAGVLPAASWLHSR
jgi:hypothetical protein